MAGSGQPGCGAGPQAWGAPGAVRAAQGSRASPAAAAAEVGLNAGGGPLKRPLRPVSSVFGLLPLLPVVRPKPHRPLGKGSGEGGSQGQSPGNREAPRGLGAREL